MSHQSGITGSAKLIDGIKKAKEENYRSIQVKIENETLVLTNNHEAKGNLYEDYDHCIEAYLDERECCYIFMRTDDKNSMGYNWIFISWVPDFGTVRDKMVYASTRATMKKEFGESYITDDITGYDKIDLMLIGYQKHIDSKSAPPPFSMAEIELNEIKRVERETALDEGHRTLKCMGFPPTESLIKDIESFAAEDVDLVEMAIVINDETIDTKGTKTTVDCEGVKSLLDDDKPRYFLFRFRHSFEENDYKSIIFIYHMPGYQATIKDRMLYSSCKAPFLDVISNHFNIGIDKKLDLIGGDISDLQTDTLLLDLHPPKVDTRPSVSKPRGPGNRGPKRLIKSDE